MKADSQPESFGQKLGALIKRKRQAMGLTQLQLAEDAYGDGGRTRRISELENGTVANPQGKTIDPVISVLGITDEELNDCAAGVGWSPDADLDRAYREARNLIEAAAAQFEHARPDASLAELEDYLRSKALEWRKLRERFEALEIADNEITTFLNQAQSALADGRLSDADDLLAQAEDEHQENKTLQEIAKQAEIRMLRADAFLFSERPEKAFEFYHSASHFFDAFKPELTIEALTTAAGRVYESSLRALTPRFEIARRLLDALAEHRLVKNDQMQLGKVNYRRGLIYMNEAVARSSLNIDRERLLQAENYARQAVAAFPVGSSPEFGVYSRTSLANILQNLNKIQPDRAILDEALDILNVALAMASDDVRHQLANVHNALGGIHLAFRRNEGDTQEQDQLENALSEFTAAMNEAEASCDVAVWGGARMNRARVLSKLAGFQSEDKGRNNFLHIRAIAEYAAALETFPSTLFPDRFADAHYELARELVHCADGQSGAIKTGYLVRALNHLEHAKFYYSKDAHPTVWAAIHIAAGNAFVRLGREGDDGEDIGPEEADQATACFQEAASTYAMVGKDTEAAGCRDAVERLSKFLA